MQDLTDDRLRERMSLLRDTLPVSDIRAPARRRPTLGRAVALGTVLVIAFGGGAVARDWVDNGWYTDGLFARGGPLYCSDLRNMTPSKAAPLLAGLGYDVTWQLEGWPDTPSHQTREAPDEGHVFDGTMKGQEMVIVVEYSQKAHGKACGDY